MAPEALDRFMLRLRLLLWPHAMPCHPPPLELGDAQPGVWRPGSPGSLTVPSPVQGHLCLRTTCPHPCPPPLRFPGPAPSSPAWCHLFQEAHLEHHPLWVGMPWVSPRGWGRDLDPDSVFPTFPFQNPGLLVFHLPLTSVSRFGRGSGLELEGLK